jgi:hypothetical protein
MMRDATEKAILFALSHSNAVNDTGLSPSDVQDMIGGWGANMQAVQQYLPTPVNRNTLMHNTASESFKLPLEIQMELFMGQKLPLDVVGSISDIPAFVGLSRYSIENGALMWQNFFNSGTLAGPPFKQGNAAQCNAFFRETACVANSTLQVREKTPLLSLRLSRACLGEASVFIRPQPV